MWNCIALYNKACWSIIEVMINLLELLIHVHVHVSINVNRRGINDRSPYNNILLFKIIAVGH